MLRVDQAVLREYVAPGHQGPLNSRQKIAGLIAFLKTYRPGPSEAVLVLALRPMVAFMAPKLPDDPAELDAALDAIAELVLALKSDPPPALPASPEVPR
jgi:hypothetical protein